MAGDQAHVDIIFCYSKWLIYEHPEVWHTSRGTSHILILSRDIVSKCSVNSMWLRNMNVVIMLAGHCVQTIKDNRTLSGAAMFSTSES